MLFHGDDFKLLDLLIPHPGAFYIMDRAYPDFQRLYTLYREREFFVRAKSNFKFKRRCSHDVDKTTGVRFDQIIMLTTHYSAQKYPEPLRRIRFYDPERQKRLVFFYVFRQKWTNFSNLSFLTMSIRGFVYRIKI
jgi:transposase, IS4 family